MSLPCSFQWQLRTLCVTPLWASAQCCSLHRTGTGSCRAWFLLQGPAADRSKTYSATPDRWFRSLCLLYIHAHDERHNAVPWETQGPSTRDFSILLKVQVFWRSKEKRALLIENRSRFNSNADTFLDVQKFELASSVSFFSPIWCSLFERCTKFLGF